MDANVAIIARGLETLNILEALNISVYLDKGFQGRHIDLQQVHNYGLIRKDTTQKLYTVRSLQHDSSNVLPRQFSVFVKILTGKTIQTDVNKNDFVEDLKQSIEDKEGVLVTQQRLMHCTNGQMEDGHTLSEYNIKEYDAIYLLIRLRGGQGTYFLPEKLLDPRYKFVYPGTGQDSRSFSRGNRSFTKFIEHYKCKMS